MNTRIPARTIFSFLPLLLLCLSACSSLTRSDEPALTTWWLQPYAGAARLEPGAGQAPRKVMVRVTAIPGLDNNRILALTADAELKPYAGARWPDHVPELTASLVSRSLQASGRFEPVAAGVPDMGQRCELTLEVREFFAGIGVSGRTERVAVVMDGSYGCGSGTAVPVRLGSSVDVRDGSMKSIVAAFQHAMNSLMQDLLKQI